VCTESRTLVRETPPGYWRLREPPKLPVPQGAAKVSCIPSAVLVLEAVAWKYAVPDGTSPKLEPNG
jgi:hypothetical protein